MSRLLAAALLSSLALAPAGCYLYSDDDCKYGDVNVTSIEARNPDTGLCEYYESWAGGGGCGEQPPGYYDREESADQEALPDWGACYGYCDGLDEYGCLATAGCRAAYLSDCPEGYDCTATNYAYFGCWQVAPSGPIQGGGCSGLDAYQCSRHDDCSARHYPYNGCGGTMGDCAPMLVDPGIVGNFESCTDEGAELTGCFEDFECPEGQRCNAVDICLPSPDGCNSDASGEMDVPCDERCYGYCIPDDPVDPGDCYGDVACLADPPACPEGTLPGIVDLCWSGYCIPLDDCEVVPPPPPCAEMATEAMCVARLDCAPIYQGIDCTCDETGCTCADWLYQECEAADATELGCTIDDDCLEGEMCCYPCGIPGCVNACMSPGPDGMCPMFP